MRTLKKALSLVLVLAMVFTLAVPALAVDKAADFKDYDKVTNKEAVDVLTAIGVINGNADGTFGADAKFTRAQGATMIAYLTLGKTVADALPTSATKFSDVPANFWGAKYIQYCANEGIINGYGNGKFGPDDELTSAQWALMLLGALGYSSKNEGIGGTGWEIAATRLAMKAGVASADDMVGTMTRDTAAKMAFNTLKADLVEYQSNGTNITVGDTNINVGATKAEAVETKNDNNNIKADGVIQFAEEHFQKLKVASEITRDSYGRPAHGWEYKNEKVGTYADSALFTYTGSFNGNVVNDLQKQKYTFANTGITYNGGTDANIDDLSDLYVNDTTGVNGYTVELYATDAENPKKITDVIVSEGYFAEVGKFTAAKGKNPAKVVLTVYEHGYTDGADVYDMIAKYATGDFVVAFCKPGWDSSASKGETVIFDIQSTTAVAGKISKVTTGKYICTSSVVIDGTTYALNNECVNVKGKVNAGDEGTLYLDAQGNVIGYKGTSTAVTDKAIAVKDCYTTLENGKLVTKVEGILSSGETTTLVVDKTYDEYAVYTYADADKDDVYTLLVTNSI